VQCLHLWPNPCDPNPGFIAPFVADRQNPDHWVAGGKYVWDNQGRGWSTACSGTNCDWKIQYDTGVGPLRERTRRQRRRHLCGLVRFLWRNPLSSSTTGAGFVRGLATNVGGMWHEVGGTLPNRYITGIAIDPANPLHAFVSIGGFSRRDPERKRGRLTERLNAAATGCGKSGRRGRPSAQGRRRRREPQLVVDIQRGNKRASRLRALSWNYGLLDVWSSRTPSIG
jgi:hypothetical protein